MFQVRGLKGSTIYELGFVREMHEAFAIQKEFSSNFEKVWIVDLAMELFCG